MTKANKQYILRLKRNKYNKLRIVTSAEQSAEKPIEKSAEKLVKNPIAVSNNMKVENNYVGMNRVQDNNELVIANEANNEINNIVDRETNNTQKTDTYSINHIHDESSLIGPERPPRPIESHSIEHHPNHPECPSEHHPNHLGEHHFIEQQHSNIVPTTDISPGSEIYIEQDIPFEETTPRRGFFLSALSIDEARLSVLIICLLLCIIFGGVNYMLVGDITANLTLIITTLIYAIAGVNITSSIVNGINSKGEKSEMVVSAREHDEESSKLSSIKRFLLKKVSL